MCNFCMMELKSVKVSKETWEKLMKWRIELECKSIEELIDKILKRVNIEQLKKEVK